MVDDVDVTEQNAQLREAQRTDKGSKEIVDYLEGRERRPTPRLRRVASQFVMKDGLLQKKVERESGARFAIVVPNSMRAQVLHRSHDVPTAGHQGVPRTFNRIRMHYYWRTMFEDVKKYVDSCTVCKAMKASTQKPMGKLRPLEVSEVPFQRIAIDKFGHVQNSVSGYKYVFVVVDFCTRFVTAEATKDATAATAAEVMTKMCLERPTLRSTIR